MREIKRYRQFILYAGFFISFSAGLSAQEDKGRNYFQPLQDVFQADLVYPQEKNEVQLTLIPEFQSSDDYYHFQFPVIVEYGLTDNWQLELTWNTFQKRLSDSVPDVKGTGDMEIGTQYSFMNIGSSNFHTAVGFELGIPLVDEDKGLGEEQWEYEPYISLALDIPTLNNLQLFAQAGVGFVSEKKDETETSEGPDGNEFNINGGFFIPFNHVIVTSECIWLGGFENNSNENQLYFTPGIVFNLPGSWEAGLGIPFGLNDQSDTFRVMALLTYEFTLCEDKE